MTAPLHDLTDAHLQAALDALRISGQTPSDIRTWPVYHYGVATLARQIAANEKLAAERDAAKAELAELRAKYEPAPVDPVKVAVDEIAAKFNITGASSLNTIRADCFREAVETAIRRGIEMQPAPFTREEVDRIANTIGCEATSRYGAAFCALTTPHAELRAMLGDG